MMGDGGHEFGSKQKETLCSFEGCIVDAQLHHLYFLKPYNTSRQFKAPEYRNRFDMESPTFDVH